MKIQIRQPALEEYIRIDIYILKTTKLYLYTEIFIDYKIIRN